MGKYTELQCFVCSCFRSSFAELFSNKLDASHLCDASHLNTRWYNTVDMN